MADKVIVAMDKTCALEMVQAGELMTDYDKLIDRPPAGEGFYQRRHRLCQNFQRRVQEADDFLTFSNKAMGKPF